MIGAKNDFDMARLYDHDYGVRYMRGTTSRGYESTTALYVDRDKDQPVYPAIRPPRRPQTHLEKKNGFWCFKLSPKASPVPSRTL